MAARIVTLLRDWYQERPAAKHIAELVSLGIFCLAIIASAIYANAVVNRSDAEHHLRLAQQVGSVARTSEDIVRSYNHLLLGAASLYVYGGELSRDEWARFYQGIGAANEFPNTIGVGYAKKISASDIATIEQNARAQGIDTFTYRREPDSKEAPYTTILYLEPKTAPNARALGFDMYSEPARRAAMVQARDEARVAMSAPVKLVQDDGNLSEINGVLIYYPVYEGGVIPRTVEARRALLKGYFYIAARPGDIIERYLAKSHTVAAESHVLVADRAAGVDLNIYEQKLAAAKTSTYAEATQRVTLDGREWEVKVGDSNSAPIILTNPWLILALGTLLGLALAAALYRLLYSRLSNVEQKYESEVQRSKDELLALASHQLRTPASGVKQYIGMLTTGIMGELTPAQQTVAQKAYDTNERQIHIINELLYVSKIDAGQLLIEPRKVDITQMVQKSIDDVQDSASQKDITIGFRNTRPKYVIADANYLRMIVENLLTNAIKYSYPASRVAVRLYEHADVVDIEVKDSGVGIAREDYERAFGKFNRIDNPMSYTEGGSGLGLFLARQLARAHGGDITVKSQVGKGSTFRLRLPKELTINSAIVNLNDALG